MNTTWPSAATPTAEASPSEEWEHRFFSKKRHCYPPRHGLNPPHQTLFLSSSPTIGPPVAPWMHGDDVWNALSSAANLTPRHMPAAAGRSAPESPRTAC